MTRLNWLKIITILLVLGSFYLGVLAYQINFRYNDYAVGAGKNFSAQILKAVSQDFELNVDGEKIIIPRSKLSAWTEKYIRMYGNQEDLRFSSKNIEPEFVSIARKTDRKPINARLAFDGARATVFTPPISGKKLDVEKSIQNFLKAVYNGESNADATISYVEPDITLEKIGKLGINTLIGRGESDFSGSPPSRIHNIKTASNIYNGLLVKPGEQFSFNEFLGDVSATTGYKPELVIKSGKLEYEYGGGVCQVSTTLFRAAIYAGLPIKERQNHSFPVRYYNPQGFDATIYPGVVDLKFVNDTGNNILIQSKIAGNKITFELYGTDDGRKISVAHPVSYDQTPEGALKAYFTRSIVMANGEEIKNTFRSNYKPPVKYEANPLE